MTWVAPGRDVRGCGRRAVEPWPAEPATKDTQESPRGSMVHRWADGGGRCRAGSLRLARPHRPDARRRVVGALDRHGVVAFLTGLPGTDVGVADPVEPA